LRNQQLGFKFRRQFPIGSYFGDLCCKERRLIIEADGHQHATDQRRDERRTAFLAKRGYRVVRFWNNVVLENRRAEGFASQIAEADAYAKKTFAVAGYELVLFPPLKRSIELGGGYRCASNHLRP